jgi:hypothetical protein
MAVPYYDKIMEGDVAFFMESEHTSVKGEAQTYMIYFKHLYRLMKQDKQPQFVEYIRKLTSLCAQYHKS